MASRDYYEILGIDKNATDDEIKKAYRRLAKQYHPDVNKEDKDAEAKFKEINEAYEVLSDPQKRAQYDQFGTADPNAAGGFGGFGGFGDFGQNPFGDIFDMFFGEGFGGGRRDRRNAPQRGADIRYDIELTFEEAAFGTKKDIKINRTEPCPECGGSGAKKGTSPETCPHCHGTGQIQFAQNTAFGRFVTSRTCDRCGGKGTIITDPCPHCHGRGTVKRQRTVSINIPAGIDDGQILTLSGEGELGKNGGSPGDLLIAVKVKPHKVFRRQGADVYCDIPISFVTAALGGDIEVLTLDGKIKYHIPEGTQPGTQFKLKGKGIPYIRGYGRGDQYINVIVDIPKGLTQEQKDILRQFEASYYNGDSSEKKSFFTKVKDALGG